MPRKAEDLSGRKFNRLTVIERAWDYPAKGVFFKCICDCGKERIVRADRLRNGVTKSCGCYSTDKLIKYNKEEGSLNLINKRFGKLTVIEKTDKRDSGSIVWKCQCDCGSIVFIRGTSLMAGVTKSCGCTKSWGEEKISNILKENNIVFIREKSFDNLRFPEYNRKARFDFAVYNQEDKEKFYLIEFDGKQHMQDNNFGHDDLEKRQKHDEIKNQWCKENNIPLIRIPYTHLKDLCLDDLLLETSQFIFN